MRKYIVLLWITLTAYGEEIDYFFTNFCPVTPAGKVIAMPVKFNLSNDLAKSMEASQGRIFILTGKLVDINCVPIVDAKVNIWYENKEHSVIESDDSFTGTAITNNLGIFNFIVRMTDKPIYMQVIISDINDAFYRTIHVTEDKLSANDLYKLNPSYASPYPQYKFLWTLNLKNNYLSY